MGEYIILGIIVVLVIGFFMMVPMGLWISAVASGVKVGIIHLIGMRLRRVRPAD